MFSNPEDNTTPTADPVVTEPTVEPTPQANPYGDLLKGIATEDGRQKYADVPTALNGLKNAQDHITTLTAQLAEANSKVDEARGIDDILAQLNESNQEIPPVAPTTPNVSTDQVTQMIEATLAQKEQVSTREANSSRVEAELITKFGNSAKALEVFTSKATELGMTVQELTAMAGVNPNLVLGNFVEANHTIQNSIQGTVNTSEMKPNTPDAELKPVLLGATSEDLLASYRSHAVTTKD